jgi:hypothetical protein
MNHLSPELQALAFRLARKHRIPESPYTHPKVVVRNADGTVDTFMTDKLRNSDGGHYVPYCLVGTDCGRVRKTEWGFECPVCGNKMNWDLTHYDGNINVEFDGPPPVLSIKQWNEQVEAKKRAKIARRYSNLLP